MSLLNAHEEMVLEDPIELVSRLVIAQDWFLKKTSAHALLADVPGRWGHYQLLADWHADTEVLNVEARLDVLVERKDELSCLLYTSPSPRDRTRSRMPSSA